MDVFCVQANLWYAFRVSNLPGQLIVLILLLGSVYAWSAMITKFFQLKKVHKDSVRFIGSYRGEPDPVALFVKRQALPSTPFNAVYTKVCTSLGSALEVTGSNPEDLFMGGVGISVRRLSIRQVDGLRDLAERVMADEVLALEDNMTILATAVSAAPLLGLLGTVWGVMEAFGGMSVSGSALLSAVAPGISGALLTTVVGLVVAIPSTVGYNMISANLRRYCVDMENFVQEFLTDIERKYTLQGSEQAPCDGN